MKIGLFWFSLNLKARYYTWMEMFQETNGFFYVHLNCEKWHLDLFPGCSNTMKKSGCSGWFKKKLLSSYGHRSELFIIR